MTKIKKYKIIKLDVKNNNEKNNYDLLYKLDFEKLKNNKSGGYNTKYNGFINSDYSELCYDYNIKSEN